MKLIDRLVLKELIGPWLFGVGLFSVLLFAATFLGRVTEYIAEGVPARIVWEYLFLLGIGIVAKTFVMAVLLAALLGFGRLSSDSEIVALRAGGAGLTRIIAPVAAFSILIAVVTFIFDEQFVPAATKRAEQLATEVAKSLGNKTGHPIAQSQIKNQKLQAWICAKDFDVSAKILRGVTVITYDQNQKESFILFADELEFHGVDDWRIRGGARGISADFRNVTVTPGDVWPKQIPKPAITMQELVTAKTEEGDALSMSELKAQIDRSRRLGDRTPHDIADLEFKFWNKIAIPLAAFVFGTLGAVLGITNHRAGSATGFALALAIIFGYQMLANFMNVWAGGGLVPPWVGSFAPLVIGMACCGVIMWRRNS